jgi:ATP-dependent helicase YprA (DUF1998 family)
MPDRDVFYVADPISSIPDLWQQHAVRALQQGKDVVVQAPTGSGKTYIFPISDFCCWEPKSFPLQIYREVVPARAPKPPWGHDRGSGVTATALR